MVERTEITIQMAESNLMEGRIGRKPPLGAVPAEIAVCKRMVELAEAIRRYAAYEDSEINYTAIEKWAEEIAAHCQTMKRLQGGGGLVWQARRE